jgi:hypothetical protein
MKIKKNKSISKDNNNMIISALSKAYNKIVMKTIKLIINNFYKIFNHIKELIQKIPLPIMLLIMQEIPLTDPELILLEAIIICLYRMRKTQI